MRGDRVVLFFDLPWFTQRAAMAQVDRVMTAAQRVLNGTI
jgi:hypothetical protein